MRGWLHDVLGILLTIVVAGFIAYVIDKAPIVAEPYKAMAKWVVFIIAGILVILFLVSLVQRFV